MYDILRPSGGNPGGIQKLEFTPIYGVSSFPSIIDCEIAEDLVFKDGFRWYKIETIENSLDYVCDTDELDEGVIHKIKVSGTIRGDEAAIKKALNNIISVNAFYLKVKDNTGMTLLAGYGQETFKFKFQKKSGDGMPGLRSYTFNFYGNLTVDPPIYNL